MKRNYFLIALAFSTFNGFSNQALSDNFVVCNKTECPGIENILKANETLDDKVIVYQSSNKPEFMERSVTGFSSYHNGGWQHIDFKENDIKKGYPIIGFGGAFTDSASMLYQHMEPFLQQAFLDAYFSSDGIMYSVGRVPMAGCDFSCRSVIDNMPVPSLDACIDKASTYTYADKEDADLNNFSLQAEDFLFKIPMIKDAMKIISEKGDASLRLFASPWSAPAWMKTNNSMIHGSLKTEFYQPWANYFVKFLKAYAKEGVKFWGVTVQNEPVENFSSMQTWQTMYFTSDEEASFIKNNLGPTLSEFEKEYGSKINLIMHDDQIRTVHSRAEMVEDPIIAKYVAGSGMHWYTNNDLSYANLDRAYQVLNEDQTPRFILGTEACEGYIPFARGPKLGDFSRAEKYAHDIMSDLNHYVSGWTDWNLALDMKGGPNWAKNYVDAPILVDLENQTLYKQPMYFYMGHFSKFLRPGSVLIDSKSEGPLALEEVSFKVPAYGNLPETIVVVVLNRSRFGKSYYVQNNSHTNKKYINMYINGNTIQTIIFKAT